MSSLLKESVTDKCYTVCTKIGDTKCTGTFRSSLTWQEQSTDIAPDPTRQVPQQPKAFLRKEKKG